METTEHNQPAGAGEAASPAPRAASRRTFLRLAGATAGGVAAGGLAGHLIDRRQAEAAERELADLRSNGRVQDQRAIHDLKDYFAISVGILEPLIQLDLMSDALADTLEGGVAAATQRLNDLIGLVDGLASQFDRVRIFLPAGLSAAGLSKTADLLRFLRDRLATTDQMINVIRGFGDAPRQLLKHALAMADTHPELAEYRPKLEGLDARTR